MHNLVKCCKQICIPSQLSRNLQNCHLRRNLRRQLQFSKRRSFQLTVVGCVFSATPTTTNTTILHWPLSWNWLSHVYRQLLVQTKVAISFKTHTHTNGRPKRERESEKRSELRIPNWSFLWTSSHLNATQLVSSHSISSQLSNFILIWMEWNGMK